MDAKILEHIRQLYGNFGVAADRVLASPDLQERFAVQLRAKADQPGLATEEIMILLLRCRKAGKLPRLRYGAGRP
jgi:hypothetical protein